MDEAEEVVVCPTCKRPSDDNFMICCDKCDSWYHGKCVGQFANKKLKWYGPCCSNRWMGEWIRKRAAKRKIAAVDPIVVEESIDSQLGEVGELSSSPSKRNDQNMMCISTPSKGNPWKVSSCSGMLGNPQVIPEESISSPGELTSSPSKRNDQIMLCTSTPSKGSPWKVSSRSDKPENPQVVPEESISSPGELTSSPSKRNDQIMLCTSTPSKGSPWKVSSRSDKPENPQVVPEPISSQVLCDKLPNPNDFKGVANPSKAVRALFVNDDDDDDADNSLSLVYDGKSKRVPVTNISQKKSRTKLKKSTMNFPRDQAEDLNSSIDSDLSEDFIPRKKQKLSRIIPANSEAKPKAKPLKKREGDNADWDVVGIDEPTLKYLQQFLPVEYNHAITAVQPYKFGKESLTAIIRLPIDNSTEALDWLTHFQSSSFSDYRVLKTFPRLKGLRVVFKKQFRCHHNTQPNKKKSKRPHKKHVECPAKIMITIKNKGMQKSEDKLLQSHPMEVRLRHWHKHPIQASDVLRFRRPTKATKKTFLEYFKKGHTPSSALKCHKFELQAEDGDDFFLNHADGSVCPDLNWCYYQYYKIFKAVYGANYGESMVQKLQEVVQEYNVQCESKCAEVFVDDEDIVVALCTPLMKRVHELLKSSSELVIMDFSGNMDRYDTRIGFLIAPSLAGGLPLGIIMTSSETEVLVTKGLKMLQNLYPQNAFYGRGELGPKVFITDAAKNERNSLTFLYPFAILLLCYFHTLQAFLRYVTAAEHNVKKEDRIMIYDRFKDLVRSKTEEDFESNYNGLVGSELLSRNKKVYNHLVDAYPNRNQWALCFRSELIIRGNNTSNLAEGNFLQLKSTVLERLKAFNMVQLFDFLVTKLDSYYKSRIASVLNNRVHVHQKSKYHAPKADKLLTLSCTNKISDSLFEVKNSKSSMTYLVDMDAEICSCPMGFTGAPCKHQYYVAKTYGISSAQFHETCGIEDKLIYHKIMVGNTIMPQNWYKSLHDGPQNTSFSENDEEEQEIKISEISSPDAEHIEADNAHNAKFVDQGAAVIEDDACEVEEWRTKLKAMFEDVDQRLAARPELFLPGVRTLVNAYNKIREEKSDNGIASSLFSMKNALKTGNRIKPNPTAGPRRKGSNKSKAAPASKRIQPHLGPRACKLTGKPTKAARVAEHGYNSTQNRKGHFAPAPPAKKRHIASHSLAQRVDLLRK